MGEFSFQGLPEETHQCTSHRDGDWITWRCPHCLGYERKLNWRTGEMKVKRGNSEARHTGASSKDQNMKPLTQGLNMN